MNGKTLPNLIFVPSLSLTIGFTLIELLIVITIIGVLATALVLAINPLVLMKRSRDSVRKSDLGILVRGLDLYMVSGYGSSSLEIPGYNGVNPVDRDSTQTDICGSDVTASDDGGWLVSNDVNLCDDPGEADLSPFISIIPLDPINNATYKYSYDSDDGSYFCLQAVLEETGSLWQVGTDLNDCAG